MYKICFVLIVPAEILGVALLKSSSGEFPELVVSTETFLVTRSLYTGQASGSSGKQL